MGGKAGGEGSGAAVLAALGIVFGDLGTSPLYTYQTVIEDAGKIDPITLLGSLSLLVWSLILVVTLKYTVLVMRADNHGEGGILALLSLVGPKYGGSWLRRAMILTAAGLFGASLLYGDGVITPAISVLSAVEGVGVVTKALDPYVLPAAVAIILALFVAQPLGTARIGGVFGPVMLLWFAAIGLIGLCNVVRHPEVLRALNPWLGVAFLIRHRLGSLTLLGGVFLALTGAEALYADMSHVGRRPVRIAWGVIVFPALVLSYAGQTAGLAARPSLAGNPFFTMMPSFLVIPMVVLATLATIIASQAIITGVFTLTRQAIQLGWFPGLLIRQTSDTEYGQIYVPMLNWTMMALTVAIAVGFGSSSRLSSAYGTAVSTTMLMTTILLYDVMRVRWRWPRAAAVPAAAALMFVDLTFFVANLLKIANGGFVPLLIGAFVFTIMITWRRGIELLGRRLSRYDERVDDVLAELRQGNIPRPEGSMVFLSRAETHVPPIVARHVAEFRSLPGKVVVLSVRFETSPRVEAKARLRVEPVMEDYWFVQVRFGFVEIPDLESALRAAREKNCNIDVETAFFVTNRDDIYPGPAKDRMTTWRRTLFGFLYRNAVHPADRFALPRDRLIEIGRQVEV